MKKLIAAVFIASLVLAFGCSQKNSTVMVPSEGQVCFEVQPADAQLFVDVQDMGKVNQYKDPKCLTLGLGRHDIQILKSGFLPYTESINVGQAKQFVKTKLVKEQGNEDGKPSGGQGKEKDK